MKAKEVKNYVVSEAFKQLPNALNLDVEAW